MNATVRFDVALSAHTAWRTGGPCDVFVVAHDDEAVVTVLSDAKKARWNVHVLGTGSRVLVRDGGFDGIVLKLGPHFRDRRILDDDRWIVGGATPVGAVVAHAVAHGLAVPEAAWCAAGTFGASVLADGWNVESIDLARASGVKKVSGDKVGARTKGVVLRGIVKLERVGEKAARKQMLKALSRGVHPPGCWFKGGRGRVRAILHRAELDRVRLRQVAIPDGAPELLVNLGGASASDLQLLQKSAIERVKRTRGVALTTTKKWVGAKA